MKAARLFGLILALGLCANANAADTADFPTKLLFGTFRIQQSTTEKNAASFWQEIVGCRTEGQCSSRALRVAESDSLTVRVGNSIFAFDHSKQTFPKLPYLPEQIYVVEFKRANGEKYSLPLRAPQLTINKAFDKGEFSSGEDLRIDLQSPNFEGLRTYSSMEYNDDGSYFSCVDSNGARVQEDSRYFVIRREFAKECNVPIHMKLAIGGQTYFRHSQGFVANFFIWSRMSGISLTLKPVR